MHLINPGDRTEPNRKCYDDYIDVRKKNILNVHDGNIFVEEFLW